MAVRLDLRVVLHRHVLPRTRSLIGIMRVPVPCRWATHNARSTRSARFI